MVSHNIKMKSIFKKLNPLQSGILLIFLLDLLGSLTSRWIGFNYQYIGSLSIIIYLAVGFLTTKKQGLKKGILYTALMGLFDSTIGWAIATVFKANMGKEDYSVNFSLLMVVLVIIMTSIIGLIGGGVALALKQNTDKRPAAK